MDRQGGGAKARPFYRARFAVAWRGPDGEYCKHVWAPGAVPVPWAMEGDEAFVRPSRPAPSLWGPPTPRRWLVIHARTGAIASLAEPAARAVLRAERGEGGAPLVEDTGQPEAALRRWFRAIERGMDPGGSGPAEAEQEG